MDVTSTTQTATAAAPAGAATAAAPKASDYSTFLTMLTAQIKNQDPLNPMSSDNFASQLATFSAVEQQTKTNDLLTQQLAQNTQSSMAQMVGWVGKEARVAAPVHFDGTTPVVLSPNPSEFADRTVLVVTNAQGNAVARTGIPVSSADYEWLGLNEDGNPLAEGIYTVSLESYQGDKLLGTTATEHFGVVNEIRSTGSGTSALFDGGVEVSTALISALRQPTL
ncbi:MAG: flagellar hook assembly protein FlgD [Pseudorhodobacter sp.]|nr:flagellar hook assembly protein FlgD [Pseudorhodobacter sp.]